jgi:DNA-binding winged helix-turn-helix (wHTH) protein
VKPSGPSSRYYAFGPFVLDGLRGIVWQDGSAIPLTPKVIQLLAALVSRAGELLPKDELIREVWGGTVVEENNLARHVSTIRKALGERPGQREYIATIPGVGYRFVASVTRLDELPAHDRLANIGPADLRTHDDHAHPAREIPDVAPHMVRRWSAIAAFALTVGVAAFATAAWWTFGTRDLPLGAGVGPTQRSLRQLSYGSGLQQDPAWSPDGSRIAYAADHSGNADLWVQTIGESEPVRLTSSPFNDWQPSWSPNGEEIVFRSERDGGGLYLVSTRGGMEKRLVDFGARPQWSPSGRLILFSQAAPEASAAARMYVMASTGAGLRVVSHERLPAFRVLSAAWHPDGRISAWGRNAENELSLVTFLLDGGPVLRSVISDDVARKIADAGIELSRFV